MNILFRGKNGVGLEMKNGVSLEMKHNLLHFLFHFFWRKMKMGWDGLIKEATYLTVHMSSYI